MTEIQNRLRRRAHELLESGEVATVIGWEAGRFHGQTTPLITADPDAADRLVYDEYCVNTLAKYVLDVKGAGRVALCVRGCDSRAVNRMVSDNQFTREQVYLLGLPCSGMKDRSAGLELPKCVACRHHDPVVYDEMLGEPTEAPLPEGRFAEVERIEALDRGEREKYFDSLFSRCIRCYACRDVCPCCTCRECFVDQRREGWLGKQNNLTENRFYGLTRVMHVGDRCIECGECERVCPMDLPLMVLNRKVIRDINELFGEHEAGMEVGEVKDPLGTYRLDDVEEFM